MAEWLAEILEDKIRDSIWKRGSVVNLAPDLAVVHDLAFPAAARSFKAMGEAKVENPDKIYIFNDHLQPAKDIFAANLSRIGKTFAIDHGIENRFIAGRGGILTVVMDEMHKLEPGMLLVGTDTHMPTYGAFGIVSLNVGPTDLAYIMHNGTFWFEPPPTRSIRLNGATGKYTGGKDIGLWLLGQIGMDGGLGSFYFICGDYVDALGICSRRHLCNMMVETGAVGSIMSPNADALAHLGVAQYHTGFLGDVCCDDGMEFDVTEITPMVALPGRSDNVKPVSEIEDVKVDTVFIGSCAGGSVEDLTALDEVLEDNEIHPRVKLIVIPQSAGTFKEAEKKGIIERIARKGAFLSSPGCGPCMGGHLGVLAAGEVCVSTSPRNFSGRMGSRRSELYLSNAWVAASAAVTGKICHPGEVLND